METNEKIIQELSTRLGDIVSNYEIVIARLKVRAQEEVDRLSTEKDDLQGQLDLVRRQLEEANARVEELVVFDEQGP